MLHLPVDLTFGVSPNTLPWTNVVWLTMLFTCQYIAMVEAMKRLPFRPKGLSTAGIWSDIFGGSQAVLSLVATACHLLTFIMIDWPLKLLMVMPVLLNIMGSFYLFAWSLRAPFDAKAAGEKGLPTLPEDESATTHSQQRGDSTKETSHPFSRVRTDYLSEKQWRLLSVLVVIAGFYTLLTVDWRLVFHFLAAAGAITTAIVFLACTTALCRDAVSEQCAEFAVAAAGMVISTATYWPAARIVGNVVVGAAAVHMALSLTCGLPRPTVTCSVETE